MQEMVQIDLKPVKHTLRILIDMLAIIATFITLMCVQQQLGPSAQLYFGIFCNTSTSSMP